MKQLKALWNGLPDALKRVAHTFWQAFLAVFLLGISGIVTTLLKAHNISDAESALLALVAAAATAGLSAAKGSVVD